MNTKSGGDSSIYERSGDKSPYVRCTKLIKYIKHFSHSCVFKFNKLMDEYVWVRVGFFCQILN